MRAYKHLYGCIGKLISMPICLTCGKAFQSFRPHRNVQYCSRFCYYHRLNAERPKSKTCPTCDKKFTPPMENKLKKYCSFGCYRNRGSARGMPRAMLNPLEEKYRKTIQDKAIKIHHNGLPDFLVDMGEEAFFVEVKNASDSISIFQSETMDTLVKHGIKCFISCNGEEELIPWKEIKPLISKFQHRKMIHVLAELKKDGV